MNTYLEKLLAFLSKVELVEKSNKISNSIKYCFRIIVLISYVVISSNITYGQVPAYNADLVLSPTTPIPHCINNTIKLRVVLNKVASAITAPFTVHYTDPVLGAQVISGITLANFDATQKIYEFTVPGNAGNYVLTAFLTSAVAPNDFVTISGANTVNVTTYAQPSATILPNPANVSILTNLTLNSNGAGGTGALTYIWTDGGFGHLSSTNTATTDFNSAAAGAFTVQVVVRDINLCQATDNITVNVYNLSATVATTPSPANTCPASPVLLNATPAGGSGNYTHSWSGAPGGSLNFTNIANPTFTYSTPGTYNLNYTVTDVNTAATANVPVSITVNASPAIKVVNTTNYCTGGAGGTLTVVSSDNNVSYELRNSTSGLTVSTKPGAAGTDLVWNNLLAANYFIRATNLAVTPTCSVDYPIKTITANPLPVVAPSASSPVCNGSTSILNSNAPTAVAWTWSPAGAITGSNTIANPIASPVIFTNYTVVVTDANGCQNSGSVPVNVTATPSITINDDQGNTFTICEGADIILTGTSAKSIAVWAWSSGGAAASTTVAPGTTTIYTLTVTDVDGCTNSKTQTVTVNKRPAANAGSDVKMCVGAGITLTASATDGTLPYSYMWSGGSTPANISTVVNPANDASYTVTVTDANGCTHSDNVFVDVVLNPTLTAGAAPGFGLAICDGQSTDLIANPASGTLPYTFNWPHSGASSQTVTVSPPNPVFNAGPVLTNYSVTVTDVNGCKATSNVNVTTNSLTAITIANDGQSYCQDAGIITLVGTPGGGTWTDISTPGFIIMPNTFDPAPPTTPTFYTVQYSYTNTNGCISTLPATVEILPYSTPVVSITNPLTGDTFCNVGAPNENIATTDNVGGQPNIVRTITSATAGTTDLGAGTGIFNPTAAGIGSHTITYSVVTPGCNSSASVTVNVGNPVNVTPIVDMCVGDPDQTLVVDIAGGTWHITFTPDVGVPSTVSYPFGSPLAKLTSGVPGQYSVGYELTVAACTNTTTSTCRVNAAPTIDFSIGSYNYNDNGINFCNNNGTILLTPNPTGPAGGSFSTTSLPAAIVGPSSFNSATVAGANPYPFQFTITYNYTHPATGCSNTKTSKIITINKAPVVDITDLNLNYCKDNPVFTITGDPTSGLLGPGSFTFPIAWAATVPIEAVDNGNGTATITPGNISPTGTFNITYSVADPTGCTGFKTETFTVNSLPTVDFNGIPASGKICKNATPITLTGSPTDANGTFSGSGITSTGPGIASFDPSALVVGTYVIRYDYADPVTTCTNFITKTIDVLNAPSKFSVSGGGTYCEGGTGKIVGLGGSEVGVDYTLYRDGNPMAIVVAGTGAAIDFGLQTLAGIYTVRAHGVTCDEIMTGTASIIIDPLPLGAGGFINPPATACPDGTTLYTFEVPIIANATTYQWSVGPAIITTGAGTRQITVKYPVGTPAGVQAVSVYGENACGIGGTSSTSVNILSTPAVAGAVISSTLAVPFVVCEGELGVTFSVLPAGFTNQTGYEWQTTSGIIVSDPTASSITVNFAAGNPLSINGVVRVRGVNPCGVSAWVSQAITVNPLPNVSINALGVGDVITCAAGSNVQLTAASTELPANITGWLWTPSNGGIVVAGEVTNSNPHVTHEGDFQVRIAVLKNALTCYNTATITVGADKTAPLATIDVPVVLNCNNTSINLQAHSTTPSTYQWTFTPPANIVGATNLDNPVVDQPGTYMVTVTDISNSCTGSASTTVTRNITPPNISVTNPAASQLTCLVNTVPVTGSSTTLGALYSWTGPAAATIATPLNSTTNVDLIGVYTLKVTDPANGCTSSLPVTVTENRTIPTITALVNNDLPNTNITCANTSVQLQATASAATATFAWSTLTGAFVASGAFNQFAEASVAADYSVVATDPTNGCQSIVHTKTVTQDLSTAATTNITSVGTELTCANSGTLNLTAVTTGDLGIGTYLWSGTGTLVPPLNTNTVSVTSAGTFTLTYRHSTTGCPTTANITVTNKTALPTVSINPGPYVVACANISATNAIKPTLTAVADANPLTTYLWTDLVGATYSNSTGVVTTVDKPGTYTITATNPYGCVNTANVTVTSSLTAPNISVTNPAASQLTCLVNAVPVTGASTTLGATYHWTTAIAGATISTPNNSTSNVDKAGLYTLTVTNPTNGCTSSLPVTVNENRTIPTITALVNNDVPNTNITCSNPSVSLQATASAATATFTWSTLTGAFVASGAFNQFAEASVAADYSVVATDPTNGCQSIVHTKTVTQDLTTAATTSITSLGTELTCTNSGTLNLTAVTTGDAGTGTYLWSGTGTLVPPLTNNNVNVTSAGTYTLTYRHSTTGCPTTANIVVTNKTSLPTVSINPGPYVITCANVNATNAVTPTITAVADANPLTTYLWTGPAGAAISNPTAVVTTVDKIGTYLIIATNPFGCVNSANVTVTSSLTAPNISVTTPASSLLTCLVSAVPVSGASTTLGATYHWSTAIVGATISTPNNFTSNVDKAGLYTLTVTNPANGCTSSLPVTVNENKTVPTITALTITDANPNITCTNTSVQLHATVGSVADATFIWSPGTGVNSGAYNQFNEVSAAGIYTATSTHPISGCADSKTINVTTDYSAPVINIIADATTITCTKSTIILNGSSSVNATNFVWTYTAGGNITNGGSTNTATISTGASYTLTAEHNVTGCTASSSEIIAENKTAPSVTVTGEPYTITCGNPTRILSAVADAGTTILWTGPGITANGTTLSPTINQSGNYRITATSANGCSSFDDVVVGLDTNIPAVSVLQNPSDITCTTTSVSISGSSPVAGVAYLWTRLSGIATISNPTLSTASVNAKGNFRLTVTAPNGCTNSGDVTVNDNLTAPNLTLPAVDDNELTCNQTTVALNGSSVTPGVLYSWSTLIVGATIQNGSSPTPTVDKTGNYTVVVTNPVNGCTTNGTTTVNGTFTPPTIVIAAPSGQITCATSTITLDATATTNASSYLWVASNGGHIQSNATTTQPVVDAAGRYTLTAYHTATGCPATAFVDVTADGSLPSIDVFNPFPAKLTCNVTSVQLLADASALGTKTILWTTTDGNITSADNITNPTVDKPGTYTVKITNTATGCYTIRGVTVNQNITKPTIQINVPLALTCSRLQVSITATATSVDGSSMNYTWVPGAGGNVVSGLNTLNPVVSTVADYTLNVLDNGNGCSNSSLVSVVADIALPNVSVNTSPAKITCIASSVQLNGSSSTPNVSYLWTGPGGIVNPTTTTPLVSAVGTYNLVVTNLANNCTITSPNVVVTSDLTVPTVTVNAPSGSLTCTVSAVTLSANNNTNYNYSWTGPGNISTPNSYTTTVDAVGTYSLAVVDKLSGCNVTNSVAVVQDITPAASPIISNIQTCFGTASTGFTVTSGTNVKWYGNPALTLYLGTGNTYVPTQTAAGVHSYYATSTGLNGCEGLPSEVTFTIHALPNAPITSGNSICEGSAGKTISAVGNNIKWYDATNTFITTSSSYTPVVIASGSYTYYATQTDINGCESQSRSVIYVINTVPLAPSFLNASLSVCEGSANPSFTVLGSNIKWYKNLAGAVISSQNTYQPLDIVPATYTYYATQTSNQCESTNSTGTITISALPIKYNVTGGGNYCESLSGLAVGLNNSQTGVTYELWLNGTTLVTDLPGTTGNPISFGNQLTAGTYTIIAKNVSGCSTTMNGSVAIAVNPLPRTPSAVNGPSTVCQGETVVYSVDPITNATSYNWIIPAGMQFVSGTSQNTITVYVSNLATTGSVSVVGVNSCGNGPTSGSKLIQVNSLPLAPGGSITGITTLCEGQSGTYEIANITGATSYEWTLLPGMSVVGGANTSKLDVHFNLNESGGNIWVQGKNGCGLGPKSADLAITVKKIPTPLAIPDINVCAANTTVANGILKAGETGQWSVLYGSPAVVQSPTNPTSAVTNLRMGQNTLVWTLTNNGCPAYDTVNIFNNIVAMNAGDDQVICSNSTVFRATSVTDAFWSVASGWGSGIIADKFSPISQITQIQQDTNKFVWQVTKSGCTSTDTVTIYNYRPLQPYAGIDQTVDVDHTALDATPPETGTTGFWSILNGSGTFVNAADPKTQVSGLISGTNTLVWTVVRRSCSLTDEMKIENIMLATPEAGVTQSICTNTTTLDAIFPPIGTGEWSVISGQATFTNPTSNSTKVTGLGYGNNWLKWTVRTSGIGMKYDSVLIVNNTPSVANAGPDLVICIDTANLMAGNPIYGTGSWTLINGSGNVLNLQNPNSVFRSIGQGKNDLRWTVNNNGCISEDLVSITNNTPTTAYAGLDQTICFDTTILYPNTPSIGVGTWSLISGSGAFTGNVVKNLAPDNNILRYTITKGSCKSFDDVLVVNNNPTTPAAGYDQNLCMSTATVTLNANQALQGSGVWTIISGSGSFSSYFINNPIVTNLANGTNIYRWTITKNGCTEQDEVIVSSNYIAATAGEDVTLCVDNTQLLASNPVPGIGTWSVVGNSAAIFDSQNSPNSMVRNLTKGDNTLRWTVNNNGCLTSDDVLITNNQPSQALAGENQAVCSQTANLNGNNPLFYDSRVWSAISGSATFADATSGQTTVTNLSGGPNVLRWTVTKGTCISYSDVTITSNLPVSVFAGNDQIACSNSAVLAANPPSLGTGQWSIITGAGSFSNRTSYNTTVNNLAQGDNIFKWTVSSADCHVSDTVIIRSSIPTRSIAGSNQIICSSTATLGGNTPVNGIGTWVVTSGSVNFTNRTSPTTNATDIALGTNILAWIIDKDGCQSSSEITITNNSPSAPLAGNDISICGDSTRLFADPPSIGTGKWSLVSGDAAILNTNNNETRVVNIKFGANTFRWTVTNKNCIISDDVVITSNYSIVNAGADFEVNTPSTQLIGNKPPLGTGLWTLSAGNGIIENPSSFDTRVNSLGAGSNVFEWSITYNGCTAKDAVIVNYIVWPIADFEPSTYTGCSPLEVNFVNTSIGGSPYSWNFGDGSTSNQPNIIHIFENPGAYTVRLTTTAPLGNVVIKEKKIIVHGHPTANFDVAPKEIYIPGQYISCFNYSVYADSSYWDFGDGKDLITKLAPRYNYTDTGKFNITLKVVNSYGCKDSMTIAQAVHVKKRSGFFFPEAFTPNPNGGSGGAFNAQDRSNDVFYPIIIDGSISEFEFRVYNRSGVLIFISTEANIGWDGYYKGKLQPQDVYIYKFSGRYNSGDPFQKVGNVLLIKKEK